MKPVSVTLAHSSRTACWLCHHRKRAKKWRPLRLTSAREYRCSCEVVYSSANSNPSFEVSAIFSPWKLQTFSHWEFPRSLQSRDLIFYCLCCRYYWERVNIAATTGRSGPHTVLHGPHNELTSNQLLSSTLTVATAIHNDALIEADRSTQQTSDLATYILRPRCTTAERQDNLPSRTTPTRHDINRLAHFYSLAQKKRRVQTGW